MSDLPPAVPSSDTTSAPPPPTTPMAPTSPMGQQTYPGYYAPPTNTLAIVALILAFIVPIAGAIVGHVAINQIKRTGEGGHGLALGGVIVGWVYTGLIVLFALGYLIFIVYLFSQISQTDLRNFG